MLTSLYALEFRLRNDCLLGTCQDFMSGRAVRLRIVGRNKSTLKTLKLTKKSSGTNESLPGVVFSLSGNGYYKENKTDISGVLRFSDLENGTYTLTEKKTTAGHILPGKAWTVQVSDSGINIS